MEGKFITSVEQATETVRGLQRHFRENGRRLLQEPLKDAVAEMYGYGGWQEFLLGSREPESAFDDREFERYPSGVTVFQSVIATFVGADPWRLAHRRNALGDDRNISVSLAVGDYDALGCRLEALVADKGAFVFHIEPGLRGGIEIAVV